LIKKVDLYVFDNQTEKLLTVLSNKPNNQLKYSGDEVNEQLNRDFTLQFTVPADHKDSSHITDGNLIGYFDNDHQFQLFQIYKVEEERSGKRVTKISYAEHSVYENIDNIVTDLRVVDQGPDIALPKALEGSRWVAGQVDALGPQTINYYYTDSMTNIRNTAETYKGELNYRTTTDGKTITGRYVDLLFRRGSDTGLAFEYKRNLESIKRTVEASGIKTALYGRGKGEQIETTGGYTRKTTFADVVWSKANGDPTDKPAGQEWVGDPSALALYGRANGTIHRFGTFDVDTTDPVELLQKTWAQLQSVNVPLVTYEMTVKNLEILTGNTGKKYRLGDTVYVIDRDLGLLIEARIIETKGPISGKNSQITLGNFIPDIADYNKKLEQTTQSLSDRKGVWDQATQPITDTDFPDTTPPTPTGFVATGLFKSILIKWVYDPSSYISAYELYASKVNGFTADSSNLVWKGKSGGINLNANTNETWYFRLRSVNTHGTVSAMTTQFSAATLQIQQADYAALSIVDAAIANLSADKITFGTLDGSQANIVNINADNINTGTLKAQFVRIGSASTFESGYDPSVKADYVVGTSAPSNLKAIWVDTTDPANVIWKAYDSGSGTWKAGPSGPRGPQGLQGIQGPAGDQGIQGPAGTNGVSSYTHIAYATSADGSTGFSVSDSTNKTYIGMYVDSNPTDSLSPLTYKWTLIKGADGAQGIQGPAGVDGQTPYFHIAYATNATGTSGFSTTDATGKTYIGTYTDFVAADSTDPTKYTWALIQGPQGNTGPTGKGISSIVQYYLATNVNTGVTTSTTGWTTTVQTMTTTNCYLWSYQKITYTDSSTVNTTPVIIGAYGNTGAAGKGISSVTEYYLATSASTGVTTSTTGWTTTVQAMTATNKYLWNYEKITYTDSSTTTIGPSIKGVYGDTGANGTTTYTWVKYADDIYGANMSDTSTGKRYVGMAFNKTTATESDNAGDYTWSPLYDNVKVGGRNIAEDTNNGIANWQWSMQTGDYVIEEFIDDNVKCCKMTRGSVAQSGWSVIEYTNIGRNKYKPDTYYTLSFEVFPSVDTTFSAKLLNPDGTNLLADVYSVISNSAVNNKWNKISIVLKTLATLPASLLQCVYLNGFNSAINVSYIFRNLKIEEGNISTDWSPAPEDVQAQIDYKAATDDLNALGQIVADMNSMVNSKAGQGDLDAMVNSFNARVQQDIQDKQALSDSLATLQGRTTIVETIANNSKIVTDFVNTVITESNEGIFIANGSSSTGILIAPDRISFMDGNIEVAYISNQTMQINHGIFVQSATIANFKFEALPSTPTILAIQWVGG
jgi:phage minor structural protein